MFTFSGFENYIVDSWVSNGVVTRAKNLVQSATASLKSAGAVAAVSLAVLATPTISVASEEIAVSHSRMSVSLAEGMLVVEHVNLMSRSIRDQIKGLNSVTESDVDPVTLALAQQVADALSAERPAFGAGWAARLVAGKS